MGHGTLCAPASESAKQHTLICLFPISLLFIPCFTAKALFLLAWDISLVWGSSDITVWLCPDTGIKIKHPPTPSFVSHRYLISSATQ